MEKVKWGIISTANIGIAKVIPAMQKGQYCEIIGIASRRADDALKAANVLGIPKTYGAYESLLADDGIQAVYIPLPNHLHVEWSIKALQAGKHVLCEKPVAMNLKDAQFLLQETKKYPHLKVMEAFMYRHHPQTLKAKELVDSGKIGDIRCIHSVFSYFNDNPNNVRNMADIGGGALLDIGCYCISITRFMFGAEPTRVCATIDYDPKFKTDRLASVLMEFDNGTATFTCATQLADRKFADIFGTKGRVEIENPFVPGPSDKAKLTLQTGTDREEIILDACDQYTIQGDLFSQAVLNDTSVPTPLTDAIANMKVIEKIIESGKTGNWVNI